MERARNRRQRPRGGYIFCGSDADNGRRNKDGLVSSKCGWRYPEAAENDLSGTCKFRDGYGYISPFFTEDGLGEGKSNTEILSRNGSPAASASENWSDGEYPSWLKPECFLPSIDELRMMYADLKAQGRNCNFEDKS